MRKIDTGSDLMPGCNNATPRSVTKIAAEELKHLA